MQYYANIFKPPNLFFSFCRTESLCIFAPVHVLFLEALLAIVGLFYSLKKYSQNIWRYQN